MNSNNEIIEELKHFDQATAKVLSIISHEIRGSFNIINGISNLILRDNIIKDPDVRELIHLIQSTSSKSFDLLDNLLHLSNLETINFKSEKRNVNIKNIITDVIEFYKFQINQKKLSIILDLDNNTEVSLNENMMIFIFRNLLSNAIKFSPVEGTLNIRWENSILTIMDEGKGISNDWILGIERNDWEGSDAQSTPGTIGEKGSGFGLRLCLDFLKNHGGTLHAERMPNQGTKFTVRFSS